MRRYALRDDQWERIKDLLPGREGHVGVTAKDNRLFVEAVLYRYRAGIPPGSLAAAVPAGTDDRRCRSWRDLPERFGDWNKVHTRFSRPRPAHAGRCFADGSAKADGPNGACGPSSSSTWRAKLTMSAP
jgi:transposase